jgi:hypothetical protein
VAVHLQTELEVRSNLIAACRKKQQGGKKNGYLRGCNTSDVPHSGVKETPQFAMHFEV